MTGGGRVDPGRPIRIGDPRQALHWARILTYDRNRFDFTSILADELGCADLGALHDDVARREGRRLTAADGLRLRARLAAMRDDAPFYAVFREFVTTVLAPLFGGGISYTAHPTFRVHLPRTGHVSSWHRDVDVTGRPEQINAWVPVVDVAGTATLWVEAHYDTGDYQPVPVRYGEVLLFDGGWLSHGSVDNRTSVTRVSFDLRFAPSRAGLRHPDLGIFRLRPSRAGTSVPG